MNLQLKFRIYEKYGTQSDAAREFGMREDYLSRIIRGWRSPTDHEKKIIANKLQNKLLIFSQKVRRNIEMTTETLELLTAVEVKRILKCSLPAIYKMADRGQLPCVRIPCPGNGEKKSRTMVRFKHSDVMNFIEKHYTGT